MGIHLNPVCKLADETFKDKRAANKRIKELEQLINDGALYRVEEAITLTGQQKATLSDALHDYNLEINFLKGKWGIR